jgi:aspartate racemase
VGLLGTAFTMEQDFYRGALPITGWRCWCRKPRSAPRCTASSIRNWWRAACWKARAAYRGVIARLAAAGAQAIILGCTEIMLLVAPEDAPVPLFDTTTLHAEAAARAALA